MESNIAGIIRTIRIAILIVIDVDRCVDLANKREGARPGKIHSAQIVAIKCIKVGTGGIRPETDAFRYWRVPCLRRYRDFRCHLCYM